MEFGIYGVESRIQERLNSWIPLYGANRTTIVVKLKLNGWRCVRRFNILRSSLHQKQSSQLRFRQN